MIELNLKKRSSLVLVVKCIADVIIKSADSVPVQALKSCYIYILHQVIDIFKEKEIVYHSETIYLSYRNQ